MTTTVTTTATPTAATPTEILAAVGRLSDHVRSRAAEIEERRALPSDLVESLASAGAFRILLPTSHGGAGADLVTALEMIELLARCDASVGWTTMIGASVFVDLAGLPPATFDEIYRDGPDVPIAGVFNPSGVSVPVDGGYRVSGRWAFASGCTHAAWFYGNCLEDTDRGEPRFRTVLLRPEEIEVEDTWRVIGLRGTGSHHVSVDNVVVPAERTFPTFEASPAVDDPVVRVPMPSLVALAVATVAVGTARGALDEIGAIADARTPLLSDTTLGANPLFQHDLATADTELRAMRALIHEIATDLWGTALEAGEVSDRQRADVRAAGVRAAFTAAEVTRTAYHAGGGSAVSLDNPLQRRLRDSHTITQHFIVRPDTMVTAGAVLTGRDIDVPVF